MATVISTTFKLRRGTLQEWSTKNPVLSLAEPGYVTDTNQLKIGDGTTPWQQLPYLAGNEISISPDGQSLAYNANGQLMVYGFEEASINQIPLKNEAGQLIWVTLAPVATSGLIDDLQQRDTLILDGGGAPVPEEV